MGLRVGKYGANKVQPSEVLYCTHVQRENNFVIVKNMIFLTENVIS
jgi:hypothetical protein